MSGDTTRPTTGLGDDGPEATVTPLRPRSTGSARSADALAAGTARARGERSRRTRTPLIGESGIPAGEPAAGRAAARTAAPRDRRPPGAPVIVLPDLPIEPGSGRAGRVRSGGRTIAHSSGQPSAHPAVRSAAGRSTALPPAARRSPGGGAASAVGAAARSGRGTSTPPAVGSGVEELVAAAVFLLRAAAQSAGLSGEAVEAQVAGTLAFLRRRLSGDYRVDDFGFDAEFTEQVYLPLLRPLYRGWFRVEVRGIENIPHEGGGLVVANHSGTLAMDSLMTQVAVHDEHPARRHLRMLAADLVFATPVMGDLARKSGSTLAATSDAEALLASGELAGVWPEGFKGVGKPFSERYKLQRFGRGGFVAAALRTGVPIIPCSIVGAEEIFPMLGNLKPLARLLGAPYFPVTPTFPWLGLLGLVPLPSKWIIEFGSPVETQGLGPGAAEDPMVVFDLTDQVRETIQQTLYALLLQRRSVFF